MTTAGKSSRNLPGETEALVELERLYVAHGRRSAEFQTAMRLYAAGRFTAIVSAPALTMAEVETLANADTAWHEAVSGRVGALRRKPSSPLPPTPVVAVAASISRFDLAAMATRYGLPSPVAVVVPQPRRASVMRRAAIPASPPTRPGVVPLVQVETGPTPVYAKTSGASLSVHRELEAEPTAMAVAFREAIGKHGSIGGSPVA